MGKVIITVSNMNCVGCSKRIANVLESVLDDFEIKLENKTISFEGNADTRLIVVSKLESMGYTIV